MDLAKTMAQMRATKRLLKWRPTTTIVILYIVSPLINQVEITGAIREERNSTGRARYEVPSSVNTIDRFDYENDEERTSIATSPPAAVAGKSKDKQQGRNSNAPPYDLSSRFANSSEVRNLQPLNVTRRRQDHLYQRSQISLNNNLTRVHPLSQPYGIESRPRKKKWRSNSSRKGGESGDGVDTVSALIEALDEANRRLLEQSKSLSERDIVVTTPGESSNENATRNHYDFVDERKKFFGPSKPMDLYQQHAAASNIVGQRRESKQQPATTLKPRTKRKKKKVKKESGSTRFKESPFDKIENITTSSQDANSRDHQMESIGKSSKSEVADHNLVKAGFQSDESINGDGSNLVMRRGAQHQYHSPNLASDPIGGGLTLVPAKEQTSEYTGHPLLPPHQPITATDLLHVKRQSQPKSQDSRYFVKYGGAEEDSGEHIHPMNTARRHHPELVPYHEQGAPYEKNQMGGPLYESQLPYSRPRLPSKAAPPALHRMLNNQIDYPYEQMPHHLSAQQPEPHPLSGTGNTNEPPIENNNHPAPYSNVGPNRLDWTPLIGHGGAGGDPSHPLNRAQLSGVVYGNPYDTSPPQQQMLNPLLLGLGNGGDGGTHELNSRLGEHPQQNPHQHPALANPLQHLLMAAKDQQAAALDYERRRLNYELALRNREHQMRAQHENNLERQRQVAQQDQAKLAKKQQEQQQGGQQQPQDTVNQQEGNDAGNDENGQHQQGEQQQEQGEENGREQENENQNDQQANNGQDDPDMKNFRSFAGADTDFTDLFPPGILSDAEIREMRKDQEDQKRREEQEERDKRRQQQQQADEQQGEQENSSGADQENTNQEQQQQVNSNQTGESQAPNEETKSSAAGEPLKTEVENLDAKSSASKTNHTQDAANAIDKQQSGKTIENLPSFLFANGTAKKPELEQAANKTKVRRSNLLPAPLLVLDSEFQERYMKTLFNSQNDRQASGSETPTSQFGERNFQTNQNRDWHERRASDKLPGPLIDFDDIIESFESGRQRRR